MEVQIGRRVVDQMPVILRVMSPVVRPLPQPQGAMDVLCRGEVSVVAHDRHVGPNEGLSERRGLAHKPRNHTFVALRQHGWHDVPLRRKIKQGEEVVDRLDVAVVFGAVDL